MRISVLYRDDGSIVSVVRSPVGNATDASHTPPPAIELRPAEGETLAVVDLAGDWDRRPLAEIHRSFIVVDGEHGPSLRPRGAAT